ncbi:Hemicentin-2 [Halotydeus destructor]|nr:Hemicentin-2 [Halotydeus destructor]
MFTANLVRILVQYVLVVLCTFSNTVAGEKTVVVKGIVGSGTQLPCRVDLINCGEVYIITWSKSDSDAIDSDQWKRIYLYSDTVEKPLQDLASRAKFTLDAKNGGSLSLDDVRLTDETYYKCDVTYTQGKCPAVTLVRLDVLAAPGKSVIYSGNETVRKDKALGPLSEGDVLDLKCSVSGGKPAPRLSWRQIDKDGKGESVALDFVAEAATTVDGVTSLELSKKLAREDLNTKFECRVEHEALSDVEAEKLKSRVLLDLNVGATELQIFGGPPEEVVEGDLVQLQCLAHGSRPQVNIIWMNGTQIIENAKERYQIEGNEDGTVATRSIIKIVASRFDHLAVIECLASNEPMVQPLKRSLELRVKYAPSVVMEPVGSLSVNESADNVKINCVYDANPSALVKEKTKWFKDDHELDLKDLTGHVISSQANYPVLTINDVMREDSGVYSCEVTNAIGTARPEVGVELSVVFAPVTQLRVFPDPAKGIILKEGDDLRLICYVISGYPATVSKVRWIRSSWDSSPPEVVLSETSRNEHVLVGVDRSASGNFSCQAWNKAGWGLPSDPVPIDVYYPPGPATIFQVTSPDAGLKGGQLDLDCVITEPGQPGAKEFAWHLNGKMIEGANASRLTIERLGLADKGNYSCSALNAAGSGPRDFLFVEPRTAPTLIERLSPETSALFNASVHWLTCRIECQPLCDVTWTRNGQVIEMANDSDGDSVHRAQLFSVTSEIVPEDFDRNLLVSIRSTLIWNMSAIEQLNRDTDNGNFSCTSTANVEGPAVQSETVFSVDYPPENLIVRPVRVDIIEGEMAPPIECSANSRPESELKWTFWNTVITESTILNLNHSITREMAGTYTCIASNKHGQASADVTMNVLFAPECLMSQTKSGDNEDDDTILICEARANPLTELNFVWMHNDTALNQSLAERIVSTEGAKSLLKLSPKLIESMYGTWSCSVDNAVGHTEPNCSTIIEEPETETGWQMPQLDDEDVLLISGIAGGLILLFIIILIVLFLLMRRRGKQDANKADHHNRRAAVQTSTPLKDTKDPTNKDDVTNYYNPHYQNIDQITELTNEFRRSQSLRYADQEPTLPGLNLLNSGPLERNVVYADLQLTTNSPLGSLRRHTVHRNSGQFKVSQAANHVMGRLPARSVDHRHRLAHNHDPDDHDDDNDDNIVHIYSPNKHQNTNNTYSAITSPNTSATASPMSSSTCNNSTSSNYEYAVLRFDNNMSSFPSSIC